MRIGPLAAQSCVCWATVGTAWVFPAPKNSSSPCSRHLLRAWWKRAECLAGIEHVQGLGFHGLRRAFATDLKNEPLVDLCHLGGWKDPQTVVKCYQRPDEATMREALKRRRAVT